MAESENNGAERRTVTLTLDDDSVVTCMILSVFPVGEKKYIALLPLAEDGNPAPDAETYVYRYIEHGPGEYPELASIESDEEYNKVAYAFTLSLDDKNSEL
jgi:uncharacterized protein YrzB (UPF0473 family)